MAIARLSGGPLDGQIIPLDDIVGDEYIASYGEGQIIYRRAGDDVNTGASDGPTEASFIYADSTEPLTVTAAELDDVPDA
ncbi:response regulator [Microbacterium sp. cx-59]|uniref:response regulator n=1 Tax=Microbacterium sp. cx-59 TaxID=2891207 RepID=UPI001E31D7CD|nr:response regulator [Microbacterium sp. cx-59]MCC4907640.1 response regulator [Microbacterium sp. cx-59]